MGLLTLRDHALPSGTMSRWVCLRCFEANDELVPACQACGLPRGASPPPGEEPQVAAAAPARRAGGLLPVLLRFWWVGLLVLVPVVGFFVNAQRGDQGQITRSGDLTVTDLRVGDCFDLKDESAQEVQDVTARPCTEAHEYELIHVGTMPSGDYPDEDGWASWLTANCLPAFESFVGIPYELSRYDISWFQPTTSGWDGGDRSVQCAVFDPAQSELTTSLRDAAS